MSLLASIRKIVSKIAGDKYDDHKPATFPDWSHGKQRDYWNSFEIAKLISDETPITLKWAEQVYPDGWLTRDDGRREFWIGPAKHCQFAAGEAFVVDIGPYRRLINGHDIRTRGQMRALAIVFDITLSES